MRARARYYARICALRYALCEQQRITMRVQDARQSARCGGDASATIHCRFTGMPAHALMLCHMLPRSARPLRFADVFAFMPIIMMLLRFRHAAATLFRCFHYGTPLDFSHAMPPCRCCQRVAIAADAIDAAALIRAAALRHAADYFRLRHTCFIIC